MGCWVERGRVRLGMLGIFGIVAVLLAMSVAGCASKSEKITKPKDALKLRNITLHMEPGTNGNWPVRVDLVRTKDAELLPRLTAMKADGWFGEAGTSFRDAHPDVYVDSWEIVPGTVIGPFNIRLRERVAGLLFCDTPSTPPPLRLVRSGSVLVTVDDDRCRLGKPQAKPKRRRFGWHKRNKAEQ